MQVLCALIDEDILLTFITNIVRQPSGSTMSINTFTLMQGIILFNRIDDSLTLQLNTC